MSKLLKWILYLISLVFTLIIASAYLSRQISPADLWYFSFFGLVFPIILLGSVILLIILIISKNRSAFLIAALLAIGWIPIKQSIRLFSSSDKTDMVNEVKFMSYNVRIFDNFNWSGKENNGRMLLDFVVDEQPDIICFQEFLEKNLGDFGINSIRNKLDFTPFTHTKFISEGKINKVGLAIFSKYPIINKGGEFLSEKGQLFIYADIIIKYDTIRLFNVHLESNHFNQNQVNLIDSLITINPREKKSEYLEILRSMKTAYINRAGQAEKFREAIEDSPYPVVVCGDFNDTPVSYTYKTIAAKLDDAFVESGSWLGSTYKEFMLPLRIDYLLHDKNIPSSGFKTFNVDFSDHLPIQAVLDIGGFKRQVR